MSKKCFTSCSEESLHSHLLSGCPSGSQPTPKSTLLKLHSCHNNWIFFLFLFFDHQSTLLLFTLFSEWQRKSFFSFSQGMCHDLFVIEHILNSAGQLLYNFAIISAVNSEICLFFSPYFVMATSNFPTLCILWSICIQQWNKYVHIFYDDATCASIAHISNSFSKPMCHQSNYLMLLTVAAISYIAQLALQLEVQSRGESVCG